MFRFGQRLMSGKKISPRSFFDALQARQLQSFYGVPDSLLKDLCAYITDTVPPQNHVITANEGSAVAMATGYHLATGRIPVVYMQNSGFGNALNPLLSLTHREVYQIPMLLLVGWRGDPAGKKDEPQHVAQGRLMDLCLQAAEVPYEVLEAHSDVDRRVGEILSKAQEHFTRHKTPFAILIKRDTFETYSLKRSTPDTGNASNRSSRGGGDSSSGLSLGGNFQLSREEAIELILRHINPDDVVVCTTGMPSREVFEIRARQRVGHHRDFLTVGSMGHSSSIAAGIALQRPDRQVYCIDGDGAALMHMGALAVNGSLGSVHSVAASGEEVGGSNRDPVPLLANLKHIVLNNGAHDSVGGQPTAAFDVSLTDTAKACGYRIIRSEPPMETGEVVHGLQELRTAMGPAFLEIFVKKGNRADLGRPTTTPLQNKTEFEKFLRHDAHGSHSDSKL